MLATGVSPWNMHTSRDQPQRGGTRPCVLYRPFGTGFRSILIHGLAPVARIVSLASRAEVLASFLEQQGRNFVQVSLPHGIGVRPAGHTEDVFDFAFREQRREIPVRIE